MQKKSRKKKELDKLQKINRMLQKIKSGRAQEKSKVVIFPAKFLELPKPNLKPPYCLQ